MLGIISVVMRKKKVNYRHEPLHRIDRQGWTEVWRDEGMEMGRDKQIDR